ncbi:MAG: HU family DNA-binding protein [Chloroflexota bacterium]
MNHTQRVDHVARQKRYLTKAIVRDAVELYLEALAEEIADGDWVELKGIGKMQVIQEEASTTLTSFGRNGEHVKTQIKQRLRTKIRLYKRFRERLKDN